MAQALASRRTLAKGAFAAMVIFCAGGSATAEVKPPSDITARYRLLFNGFEVGAYDFHSRMKGNAYEATSGTKISALFGAFTWKGSIGGKGTMEEHTPHPSSYDMSYKSNSKQYLVKLAFDGNRVSSVNVEPKKPPHPDAIKLRPEHLENVDDPIGALMAISNTSASEACNRTIPVFDGKSRFDLKFSPKGREAVADKRPSGQPKEVLVCRVKYLPIAGHKPKDFEKPWVEYGNIEIALRPIPSAGLFIPYRIKVPTTIGPVEAVAEEVTIKAGDNTQIALRQ
jgi:hypothetical protein